MGGGVAEYSSLALCFLVEHPQASAVVQGRGSAAGPAGSPSLRPFRDRCLKNWEVASAGCRYNHLYLTKQTPYAFQNEKRYTLWHLLFMWEFLQATLTLPRKRGLYRILFWFITSVRWFLRHDIYYYNRFLMQFDVLPLLNRVGKTVPNTSKCAADFLI